MNLLDYLLAAILVFCLIRGIFRGLVKELSSIIGVMGGLYAAYTYYPHVARILSGWIGNAGWLNIASCLVLFFGVYLIVSILGVVIKYFMNIVFLGWTDRLCGAGLGAVKGLLISAVMLTVLITFLPGNAAILRESLAARYMRQVSQTLIHIASRDTKSMFALKMKELRKSWSRKSHL
ncbi:MAG: CvpA family protein [Desulfosarcinaceae bacterium]